MESKSSFSSQFGCLFLTTKLLAALQVFKCRRVESVSSGGKEGSIEISRQGGGEGISRSLDAKVKYIEGACRAKVNMRRRLPHPPPGCEDQSQGPSH